MVISVTDIEKKTKFYSYYLLTKHFGVHGGEITLDFYRKQLKPYLKKYILAVEKKIILKDETKNLER